jgi:hypothetical protein
MIRREGPEFLPDSYMTAARHKQKADLENRPAIAFPNGLRGEDHALMPTRQARLSLQAAQLTIYTKYWKTHLTLVVTRI